MKPFENAKWIWCAPTAAPDEYAEFVEEVDFHGKSLILNQRGQ